MVSGEWKHFMSFSFVRMVLCLVSIMFNDFMIASGREYVYEGRVWRYPWHPQWTPKPQLYVLYLGTQQ